MSIFLGALEQHGENQDDTIEDLLPAKLIPEYLHMLGQFDGDEEIASGPCSQEESLSINEVGGPVVVKK